MYPPLPNLATCKKVGFIVPSSNTVVEPITSAIFHSLKDSNIIPLFTRISVKTVGTDRSSTSQFTTETMVAAARLLADAQADAILWNGTSGMWVGTGLDADRELAAAMEKATGVPCSTTTLATVAALEKMQVKHLGIAVPYPLDLAKKVHEFLTTTGHGWEAVSLGVQDPPPSSNLAIAKASLSEIQDVVLEACASLPQAVVVGCTNWPAAGIIEKVEQQRDVVIVDSIVVTVWRGLRIAGYLEPVSGWGRLMEVM